MTTMIKLVEELIDTAANKPDVVHMYSLRDYLNEKNKESLSPYNFDEFEFIRFLSYLANTRTTKVRYITAVAVRRQLGKAHKELSCFKKKPSTWPVPEKPTADHFEPLDSEQLEKLKEFLSSEIKAIYDREESVEKALECGVPHQLVGTDFWRRDNPDKNLPKFSTWTSNLSDTIVTFYAHNPEYPNNATVNMVKKNGKYHVPSDLTYTNLTNPLVTTMKRLVMQKIKSFTCFMPDAPKTSASDVMAILYPTVYEFSVIKTAICLETGWSPDIVEKINPEDYLYDPIPMEGEWAFIKSRKEKGASVNTETNIRQERQMIHPSSTTNLNSAYNLIKLFNKRTSRLRNGMLYKKVLDKLDGEIPFCVTLTINAGVSISAYHPSLESNRSAQQKYLKDNLGFNLDLRQLRPTRLYLNDQEGNLPLLLQVALYGHSTSAITDGVYKDNSVCNQKRKDKLSIELDELVDTIDNGSFKGTLVPLFKKESIKKKILNIYTNHNGESPLAICNDPYHPNWDIKGNELPTIACKNFNKCLLCSQSSVTSDNIPFVVDRFLYLDQMRRSVREDQFDLLYRDEFEAAQQVIDSWPYKEDIEDAELRNAMEGYLLPPIISEYN
ncbi:hypothetical protein OH460_04640 [Vibrio sp. Makdt]|uniref:hypothetical protein n=1 Tax=Vibrio sp. Makdt TaxID=2998828 RepID=UPI0022CD3C4D|nr:hypothetical protein [Vibrio sp. Makdt]MDA0151588.1 hypothetical protein [Vibrio sp. Makdt]